METGMNPDVKYNLGFMVYTLSEEIKRMKTKLENLKELIEQIGSNPRGGNDNNNNQPVTIDNLELTDGKVLIGENSKVNDDHRPGHNKANVMLENTRVFVGANDGNFENQNGNYSDYTVALGYNVAASGHNSIAIGKNVRSAHQCYSIPDIPGGIAIGTDLTTERDGIAIGHNLTATTNQIKIGDQNQQEFFLGNLVLGGDYGDTQAGRYPGLSIVSVASSSTGEKIKCKKIDIGDSGTLSFPGEGYMRLETGGKRLLLDFTENDKVKFKNEGNQKSGIVSLA
jgi:hypothetical protein